jgi:ATP-dependent helicase/nuclease subunit A
MMLSDQQQRDESLDPSRSFIVEAPAGSGKTSLLIKRYLNLLTKTKNPEEILAITFTRKAAAEMRSRISKALSDIPPNRLRICTIDALCNSLTRQMPILSGFGAQPNIIQGQDVTECYRKAVHNLINSLEDDPPYAKPLENVLLHLDNNYQKIETLLINMLGRRDQWLPHIMNQQNTTSDLNNIMLENLTTCITKIPINIQQQLFDLVEENDELLKWQKISDLLLTKEFKWRKRGHQNLIEQLQQIEDLNIDLKAIKFTPHPDNTTEQQNITADLIQILKILAAYYLKQVFREQSSVDYIEIALAALQALGEEDNPTELALKLDYKIQHILVDEFQDTSVTQYRLLEKLTAGWQPGDGRTLFLVGDPMQSIYKFREAKVGLFLKAKHYGINSIKLHPITLTTNFRSEKYLIEWVNSTFSIIFPSSENIPAGAIPFIPAEAIHNNSATVKMYSFSDKDYSCEAQQIIKIIKQSNHNDNIAILVRNRSHLDHIIPALKTANLSYQGIELELLNESMVIQDLFSLTKAILNPQDRIAWLAILRAPWCGLTLADLHTLVNNNDQPIWNMLRWPKTPTKSSQCFIPNLEQPKQTKLSTINRKHLDCSRWPIVRTNHNRAKKCPKLFKSFNRTKQQH